jgi:cystathionine beta-lyase
MKKDVSTATHCVHTGTYIPEGDKGVNTPIFTSSAFGYEDGITNKYPRYYNTVNQTAVAEKVAALEGGEEALVLSSGMAAVSTAMLGLLKTGDHAVLQQNLYGGTHHFVATIFDRFGILYTYTNGNTRADFEAAIQPNTKLIYIETPSNPLLEVVDMEVVAQVAKKHGLYTLIDNTFASPINQQPIKWGIDVVIHSATKYLGGHSDMCAGVIVSSKEIMKKCHEVALNLGGCLEPMPCYLLERSIKTLEVRVARHNTNAMAVANFLASHPAVTKVNYPGLPSHPDHEIAKKQMSGFGGMLSFEVKGGFDGARKVIKHLQIIAKALSLGGVESTICEPAKTSHSKLSAEQRAEKGIADGLLRLSVGIEAVEDLIADLKQALEA